MSVYECFVFLKSCKHSIFIAWKGYWLVKKMGKNAIGGCLWVLMPFNSISVKSSWWNSDNECNGIMFTTDWFPTTTGHSAPSTELSEHHQDIMEETVIIAGTCGLTYLMISKIISNPCLK